MMTSQIATWLLAMALTIVQPRLLGPETQGRLRLGFSLWTIAAVVIALGTTMYLQLEVARRGASALRLIGPVLAMRTLAFLLAAAVFALAVTPLHPDSESSWILILFGVVSLLATWGEVYTSAFIGLEKMSAPAIIVVVSKLLGTVAAIVVLFAGGGAIGLLIVLAAGNVLGLVLIVRALGRVVRVPLVIDRAAWPIILRGGFGFLVSAAVLTTYQQVDTVVISLLVDRRTLGWYAASDALFGTLLFVPTIVCTAIFPVLGRLADADREAFVVLVRRTFTSLALVAVPIGVGTVAVGREVAPLLYGNKFRPSGDVLSLLGVVLVLTSFTILFGTVALATGRQRFWNSIMFAAAVLTIPLDVVFVSWADRVHHNGAIGGAMAYVVTELMMFVLGIWRVVPYVVERATMWRVGRIVICGLAILAATWPLRGHVIVLPIGVGVIVYVVSVLLTGVLSADERATVSRVLGRLGLRLASPRGTRAGS
jgi:O-antigen/teichoic acid export membrane protein